MQKLDLLFLLEKEIQVNETILPLKMILVPKSQLRHIRRAGMIYDITKFLPTHLFANNSTSPLHNEMKTV